MPIHRKFTREVCAMTPRIGQCGHILECVSDIRFGRMVCFFSTCRFCCITVEQGIELPAEQIGPAKYIYPHHFAVAYGYHANDIRQIGKFTFEEPEVGRAKVLFLVLRF